MSMRKFVNGFTVSTTQYGNVYETVIMNKYGNKVRAWTDFNATAAKATHIKFCGLCR